MTYTTTSYGTWYNHNRELTVTAGIVNALGDYGNEYDIDAIEAEYREAIDAVLPERVVLVGDEFIGPAYADDKTWDGDLDITALIESVDFWAIAEKHETTQPDEAPQVTTGHLWNLITSPSGPDARLYLPRDEETGKFTGNLEIWVEAYVDHNDVVATPEDVTTFLALPSSPTAEEVAKARTEDTDAFLREEFLPEVQDCIDELWKS